MKSENRRRTYTDKGDIGMKYIINYENGVFKSIKIGQEKCPEICTILKTLIEVLYE